jgi:hypothetical protein
MDADMIPLTLSEQDALATLAVPLSDAQIELARARLGHRLRLWIKRRGQAVFLSSLGVCFALFVAILFCVGFSAPDSFVYAVVALFVCAAPLAAWVATLIATPLEHEPIAPDQCEEMSGHLAVLDQGEAFRQAVLAHGRRFTQRELAAAALLAAIEARRAQALRQASACKALYGA